MGPPVVLPVDSVPGGSGCAMVLPAMLVTVPLAVVGLWAMVDLMMTPSCLGRVALMRATGWI